MVALRLSIVKYEAVEDHIDALGGGLCHVELNREDAKPRALLVIVLVERLEHRAVLERLALGKVLGISANYRYGLVDQKPVALCVAGIHALGKMYRVAVRRLLERVPQVL